ncbi:hypothetical protein Rhe02_72370 [Rhizocola hellebori]|uniref:Uncharacterized protein n=1 Tax=Rhizocola hellebori TaxID=1392758 RepID=A0A8J3QGA0_9ACTN|nr:hypothetical protein [Rhizocola hellebori]GIH09170.1 hypothetical protein Rhe02_72370 [Rhizocola hellebori]
MTMTDLYRTFSRDPLAVFLHVIERAGTPVTFENIMAHLVGSGLPDYVVSSRWSRYERAIKDDPHIYFVPETRTYAWGSPPVLPDAEQAVKLLASGKAQINPDRKVLGDIILAALQLGIPPEPVVIHAEPVIIHAEPVVIQAEPVVIQADPAEQAERQKIFEDRLKADSARAYAKVAMELEELIASGASARVLLQRIHAAAQAHGLKPIESAGATIKFDRLRHESVVATTQEGTEVLVIRPGYFWQIGSEEILVAKAVVIEQ